MSVLTRFLSTAAELSGVGGYIQGREGRLPPCGGARRGRASCRGCAGGTARATRAQILKIADEVRRSE